MDAYNPPPGEELRDPYVDDHPVTLDGFTPAEAVAVYEAAGAIVATILDAWGEPPFDTAEIGGAALEQAYRAFAAASEAQCEAMGRPVSMALTATEASLDALRANASELRWAARHADPEASPA